MPGDGPFYDQNALLFSPVEEVRARVDELLQMEPLYHAIAAVPNVMGLAALVSEIGSAVEKGRSPDGLDALLLAASAAIEGEVRAKRRPVDWVALAGLGGEARSLRWFVIATPKPGLEREAAAEARRSSEGMQGLGWLWPRRALAAEPSPFRDFIVPAGLAFLVTMTLLVAGFGSLRQALAVMLSGFVTLSAAAAAAAAMGRRLTQPPGPSASSYWRRSSSPACRYACPSNRRAARVFRRPRRPCWRCIGRGGLITAFMFLFFAVWGAWAVRQLPSLNQLAMIALIGAAVALLCAMCCSLRL